MKQKNNPTFGSIVSKPEAIHAGNEPLVKLYGIVPVTPAETARRHRVRKSEAALRALYAGLVDWE